jgi:SAM-dependent methyltransferase
MPLLDINTILEWDVANWKHALPFWEKDVELLDGKRALTLGERNGGLSLWLASKGSNVICSDHGGITAEVIREHKEYSFSSRIQYADVDAFKIPFPDETFDVVALKSVIGGLKLVRNEPATRTLQNQQMAINEIWRVLKPGGYLLGAENLKGSKLLQLARNYRYKGYTGWRHFSKNELESLVGIFPEVKMKYFGLFPGFKESFVLGQFLGSINKIADPIFPSSYKYISFFTAKKSGKC